MFEEYYLKSTWFIIEEQYPKSTWFMANSMSVCSVDWWRVHLQRPPPSAFTSWTWVLRSFSSKDIFGELFAHIYHRSWHVILIIKKFQRHCFCTNHRSWNAVGSTSLPIWPPHSKLNIRKIIMWNYTGHSLWKWLNICVSSFNSYRVKLCLNPLLHNQVPFSLRRDQKWKSSSR